MPHKDWTKGDDGSWSFGAIGRDFDEHVRRHLPGYEQITQLAVSAAMWNTYQGARVLDVGCATGQTLGLLAGRSPHVFEGLGVDVEPKMVKMSNERFGRINDRDRAQLTAVCEDSSLWAPAEKMDVVLSLFGLQFIPTPKRWDALALIADSLAPGGLFILAEKTMPQSPRGADLHAGLYSDWKLQNGVEPEEVVAKWSSIRGQLIPWHAHVYESWAARCGLQGDLIWCWGPFRAWAWWAPESSQRTQGLHADAARNA
ncbi:MAG: class I SAM-dependent methyltransferase [Polyangiales bacterium]